VAPLLLAMEDGAMEQVAQPQSRLFKVGASNLTKTLMLLLVAVLANSIIRVYCKILGGCVSHVLHKAMALYLHKEEVAFSSKNGCHIK
jgi:hypothetical protein